MSPRERQTTESVIQRQHVVKLYVSVGRVIFAFRERRCGIAVTKSTKGMIRSGEQLLIVSVRAMSPFPTKERSHFF
jgi:hypothetical protein